MKVLIIILLSVPAFIVAQDYTGLVKVKFACNDSIPIQLKEKVGYKSYGEFFNYVFDRTLNLDSITNEISKHPCIEVCVADKEIKLNINAEGSAGSYRDDPGYINQWYLEDDSIGMPFPENLELGNGIEIESVWDIVGDIDSNLVIGIHDIGIDTSLVELNRAFDDYYDYFDWYETLETGMHGTWVTGINFAENDNQVLISSILGGNSERVGAKYFFIKGAKADETTTSGILCDQFITASKTNAVILEISWTTSLSDEWEGVLKYTVGKYLQAGGNGFIRRGSEGDRYSRIIACNAGNGGQSSFPNTLYHPGKLKTFGLPVMIIAGLDYDDTLHPESTRNEYIDISAPYENIYTTNTYGGGSYYSGTSFSAPMVSGVIGLLVSHWKGYFTPEDLISIIKTSARDIDSKNTENDGMYGTGALDAPRAFERADQLIKKRTSIF